MAKDELVTQPFTYAGRVGIYTESNDLYFMRARYYSAELGRFISEDPSGFVEGPNLYAYVGGNPIIFVDPSGLERVVEVFSTNTAFGQPGYHHLYVADDGFNTWARSGKSGSASGDGGGPATRDAAFEAGHTFVGQVLLPANVTESQFMNHIEKNGNNGLYLPWVNDCHNSVFDAADKLGGQWQPNENYQGRVDN